MACERFRDALTDVAAGGPAPAAVETHLATCEACRAELDALRQALARADAELAGLLSAEPSPGLALRIRQAVAEPETATAWRFGWLWPASAAATTVLVALAVWVGRAPSPEPRVAVGLTPPPQARDARVGESRATEGVASVTPRSVSPSAGRGARRAGGSLGTRHEAVPRDGTPEVLVPPGEEEALLRLVAVVHRERRAPAALAAAGEPSADLAELAPIEIEPLEIVPLDPAETSGT